MIYGIEQTTDLRNRETKVEKFSSMAKAIKWGKRGGAFAWNGASRSDIDPQTQNWHRRLRSIYQMPYGWRPPSRTKLDEVVQKSYSSTYYCSRHDALANAVIKDGEEISC